MVIFEDTRQKADKHEKKHKYFDENGIKVHRTKLLWGDYELPPKVSIDTKEHIGEIAGNIIGKNHNKFVEKCENAKKAGTKLYFLVENECGISSIDEVHTWVNPRCITSPRCVQGPRLEKAMKTIQERYGCTFLFCKPEESAEIIMKLLRGE